MFRPVWYLGQGGRECGDGTSDGQSPSPPQPINDLCPSWAALAVSSWPGFLCGYPLGEDVLTQSSTALAVLVLPVNEPDGVLAPDCRVGDK